MELHEITVGRRGRGGKGKSFQVKVLGAPVYNKKTGDLLKLRYDHFNDEHVDALIDMANEVGKVHEALAIGIDSLRRRQASESSNPLLTVTRLIMASDLTDDAAKARILAQTVLSLSAGDASQYQTIVDGMAALRVK